jgi:DNA-binding NarL/FixJ family response regulator
MTTPPPPAAHTCLVADDHPALAAAVCGYLAQSGYEPIGPSPNGRTAVELARDRQPDVAVVDWRMPMLSGPELLAELRIAAPATALLVYTAEADEDVARAALAAGAAGLVLKEAPLADLVRALDAVERGQSYVDPGVMRAQPASALTARELAVLELIADGLSHEQIGARLGIGTETVRTHGKKASARLGATTRTQAVATALRLGLIA